jgi:hypothetical protein
MHSQGPSASPRVKWRDVRSVAQDRVQRPAGPGATTRQTCCQQPALTAGSALTSPRWLARTPGHLGGDCRQGPEGRTADDRTDALEITGRHVDSAEGCLLTAFRAAPGAPTAGSVRVDSNCIAQALAMPI